ncbi:MAG: hypothetical protein QE278_10235 [Limnobacter sp.]|nr:hypothetical protein [Limnobacter sp.]
MKRLVAFFVLITAVGLIAHGVPAPRLMWKGYLTELQTKLPEYDIQIDSVVLGLSHKPVLMVSGIQIKSKANADRLDVGLLRVELGQIAGWRRGEWVVSDLKLKGLRSIKTTQQDCEGLPIRCWHSMPMRVWAQARLMLENENKNSQGETRKFHIQNMEWEQVEFLNQITQMPGSEFGLSVEELKYKSPVQSGMFSDENGTGALSAGIKLSDSSKASAPAPQQKPNQLYVSIRAKQALLNHAPNSSGVNSEAWKFDEVESDFTGNWLSGPSSYPWSGSVAVGSLILRQDGNDPFLKLQASELRTYISRLDSPADHQAAFSSRQIEGGLPAQDFLFKQAEWTFTHENAEAWTFDLLLKQARNLNDTTTAEITPATIPGSEGTPAQAQTRVLGCEVSTSYWFWQDGWFRQQSSQPKANSEKPLSGVWCKK